MHSANRLASALPRQSGEINWYRIIGVEAGATGAGRTITVAGGEWLDTRDV